MSQSNVMNEVDIRCLSQFNKFIKSNNFSGIALADRSFDENSSGLKWMSEKVFLTIKQKLMAYLEKQKSSNPDFKNEMQAFLISALEENLSPTRTSIYFNFFEDANFYSNTKNSLVLTDEYSDEEVFENQLGQTPIMFCKSKGNFDLLIQHGANLTLKTINPIQSWIDFYSEEDFSLLQKKEWKSIKKNLWQNNLINKFFYNEINDSFFDYIKTQAYGISCVDILISKKQKKITGLVANAIQETKQKTNILNNEAVLTQEQPIEKELIKYLDENYEKLTKEEKSEGHQFLLKELQKNTHGLIHYPNKFSKFILTNSKRHGKNLITLGIDLNKLEFLENCFKQLKIDPEYVTQQGYSYFYSAFSKKKKNVIDLLIKYNLFSLEDRDKTTKKHRGIFLSESFDLMAKLHFTANFPRIDMIDLVIWNTTSNGHLNLAYQEDLKKIFLKLEKAYIAYESKELKEKLTIDGQNNSKIKIL